MILKNVYFLNEINVRFDHGSTSILYFSSNFNLISNIVIGVEFSLPISIPRNITDYIAAIICKVCKKYQTVYISKNLNTYYFLSQNSSYLNAKYTYFPTKTVCVVLCLYLFDTENSLE